MGRTHDYDQYLAMDIKLTLSQLQIRLQQTSVIILRWAIRTSQSGKIDRRSGRTRLGRASVPLEAYCWAS